MRRILISTAVMLFMTAVSVKAQSVSYAKSLIEQGQYLEAAKQLRPLADGGNAEAQYLAAKLFFEGRGVTKNNVQGEKYATLSANKGNEDAIGLLASRHFQAGNYQKLFTFISNLISQHPYMEETLPGSILALCYLNGYGTQKNMTKANQLTQKNTAWMTQLQQKAPALAEAAPDIVSNMSISKVFGRDKNDKQRTPVFVDDQIIGASYSFKSNKAHHHSLQYAVYKSDGTRVSFWNSSLDLSEGDNSFWSQSRVGPLAEGQYYMTIGEPDGSATYAKKSFSVLSLAQKAEAEWQQKAAKTRVEVRSGGLIRASLESVNWSRGSLYVKVAIRTEMIRRQFRIESSYATTTTGNSRSTKATVDGINQEPGRDYYIFTNRDVAYVTIAVFGVPRAGELSEVGAFLSLSGTKEFVKVKNLIWR